MQRKGGGGVADILSMHCWELLILILKYFVSSKPQGLREDDETDAEHRGPHCLGKSRGPPLYRRKKKIWRQLLVFFTHTEKYTYLELS